MSKDMRNQYSSPRGHTLQYSPLDVLLKDNIQTIELLSSDRICVSKGPSLTGRMRTFQMTVKENTLTAVDL
jgi:hypothetical protein